MIQTSRWQRTFVTLQARPWVGVRVVDSGKMSFKLHLNFVKSWDIQKPRKFSQISDARDQELFNYSSGRWLFNERQRLEERQKLFNVPQLIAAVTKSVGQTADAVLSLVKIAEGGSYRVFKATLQNGIQVIARLPYPCSIPRRHGIASEVATMDFLRSRGIPIPKVLDWSASESNAIGSEYMIMEMADGNELENVWYTMDLEKRMVILEKIVQVERKLFDIEFPANGSLFFEGTPIDTATSIHVPENSGNAARYSFCVGPSTEYLWWYNARGELPVNRGPWQSSEAVMKAVGERELSWLPKFATKRFPREPLYKEIYGQQEVDPQDQMDRLSDYLSMVPHLIPNEEILNKPTIRHPDLSPNNIFISDSGEVTAIIDWQHTVILPMSLQAKIPKHFQNYGDEDSENFVAPKLHPNFAKLTEVEQQREQEIYRRRQVHYFYVGFTNRLNQAHFHAMGKHNLILRNQLYDVAARPWEGDNTSLHATLIRIIEHWPEIAAPDCKAPVTYSQADIVQCLDRDAKQKEADDQMQQVRDFIGINIEGWVPLANYEEAKSKEQEIRAQMFAQLDTDEDRKDFTENWPFQDHVEID